MAKGTQRKKLSDQFGIEDVGSSLLNELAEGLYTREAVLREYIQNAVDAHRLWEIESGERLNEPIQVELRPNGISILDRGIGMNEQEARNVKSVAVSPKRKVQVPVELTGHKGVGIWAGLSFFESLTLQTSKKGQPKGYQIHLHFCRILDAIDEKTHIGDALNPNYEIYEFPEEIDTHYTDVTLNGPIKDREWFLDASAIGKAIRETCPCQISPNFVYHDEVTNWFEQHGFDTYPIMLNRQKMYREYVSAVESFTTETLTVDDKPVAEVWYAISKKKMLKSAKDELIGFRLVQTGFVIGPKNPYSSKTLQGFPDELQIGEYPDWYVGEIHVVMPDLYPNLPRNDFEETSEPRRKLAQRIRKWYDERDIACRILSQKRDRLEKYAIQEKFIAELKEKGAPLTLTSADLQTLRKYDQELENDESIALEDKRTRAPKSTAHIDGRRDKEVTKRRKALRHSISAILQKGTTTVTRSDAGSAVVQKANVNSLEDEPDKQTTHALPTKITNDDRQEAIRHAPPSLPILDFTEINTEPTQSRDFSISVFLSLLEEVLNETIPDNGGLRSIVLDTLKVRLAVVGIYE